MTAVVEDTNADEESSSAFDDGYDNGMTEAQEEAKVKELAFVDYEWITNVAMAKWTQLQLQAYMLTLQYNEHGLKFVRMRSANKLGDVSRCTSSKQLALLMDIPYSDASELFGGLKDLTQKKNRPSLNANVKNMYSGKWRTKSILKWTIEESQAWIVSMQLPDQIAILAAMEFCEFDGESIVECASIMELAIALDIKPTIAGLIYNAAEQKLNREMRRNMECCQTAGGTNNSNNNNNGDEVKEAEDEYRRRRIDLEKYPYLKTSKKPCIILNYTDADLVSRARMVCGHAIAADSLYFYIKSTFERFSQQSEIYCPAQECAKQWDWEYCTNVADMSDAEKEKFNKRRSLRQAVNYRECPHCGRICEHNLSLGSLRVSCVCKKGLWCWSCSKPWLSSSARICGNSGCSFVKNVNRTLEECGRFTPAGIDGKAGCPLIRACPMCMTFIEHNKLEDGGACKHVKCTNCKDPKVEFCIMCLGIKNQESKKWPCGQYDFKCGVAPIQVFT